MAGCHALGIGPGSSYLTDANGVVAKTYPAVSGKYLNCLLLPGNPAANGDLTFFVARPGIVYATPSVTSAPVGQVVPVNGSVQGGPYRCQVLLQRLYSGNQWRTVNSGAVRESGRFTLSAQPAYKGLISYRVYFPKCDMFQAGVSKTFTIRGT